MKKISIIAWIGIGLAAGCSSSKITSSWTASGVQPKEYRKILVLGLINEPDRSIRENMETHLVNDLKDMGYNAVCSCIEFDPRAFENMSEKEALAKLDKSGIDAVLTIVLLDKQKEKYYVPERLHYSPYSIYHNRFWGYYTTIYDRVYAPGYYTVNTKYFWESNFYSLSGNPELMYSVQSQSFEPGTTAALSHEYGRMIVKDIVNHNILVAARSTGLKPI